jgi:hypothetical protein
VVVIPHSQGLLVTASYTPVIWTRVFEGETDLDVREIVTDYMDGEAGCALLN